MMTKAWNRSYHEEEAVRAANEALRACMPVTLKSVVKANRMVAHARTHLVSIGPNLSRRTERLFAFVCRVEKRVAKVTAELETL